MSDPTEAAVMPGDGESTREIVRRTEQAVQVMPLMSDEEIHRAWRVAGALAKSGMFKDVTQAEQAFAKILLGRDLGLSPTQAMTGIHIVEGKPEVAAVTLASFVRRLPGVRYHVVEQRNDACEIHYFSGIAEGDVVRVRHAEGCPQRKDDDGECICEPSEQHEGEAFAGSSRFDNSDVERAELGRPTRNGAKSNHVKYPRNMKFARAMSNGIKWFCPEATAGIPVYHEGEIEERPLLTAGHGDGQARNIALPPGVEEVLKRAETVGHAGLADRATAEMALDGQPPEFVAEWVKRADRELHEFADSQISDAEVVPDGENGHGHASTREGQVEWLRREAERHLQLSLQAGEEGDRDEATSLEHEARRLRAEADTLEAGGQAAGA